MFNFFIKTFWGLNLLPSSDVRYSTKVVCSVGPFRHSLYHRTTKDILRGIFSSRRQGFELPICTVDRTEHEAQGAKSHYCSSVKGKPQLRAKHVKKGVSVLLKIPHYYNNTGSMHIQIHARARAHMHAYIPTTTRESSSESAFPSRASKEKCVNFGAT